MRKWFRFSLRDICWLILTMFLLLAWMNSWLSAWKMCNKHHKYMLDGAREEAVRGLLTIARLREENNRLKEMLEENSKEAK